MGWIDWPKMGQFNYEYFDDFLWFLSYVRDSFLFSYDWTGFRDCNGIFLGKTIADRQIGN